jgi:hypothetical protein
MPRSGVSRGDDAPEAAPALRGFWAFFFFLAFAALTSMVAEELAKFACAPCDIALAAVGAAPMHNDATATAPIQFRTMLTSCCNGRLARQDANTVAPKIILP